MLFSNSEDIGIFGDAKGLEVLAGVVAKAGVDEVVLVVDS